MSAVGKAKKSSTKLVAAAVDKADALAITSKKAVSDKLGAAADKAGALATTGKKAGSHRLASPDTHSDSSNRSGRI